jgi:hypothetical protein
LVKYGGKIEGVGGIVLVLLVVVGELSIGGAGVSNEMDERSARNAAIL